MDFVRGLRLEIARRVHIGLPEATSSHPDAGGRPRPRTLYVGGGTPTALPLAVLADFFAALREGFDLARCVEFSVEANPEDFRQPELAPLLAAAGVTRVTLGAQSLQPRLLRALGRAHGPDDVREAVARLRAAEIRSIGADLIFASPGQTLGELHADVRGLVDLQLDHISSYALTYGEDTAMTRWRDQGRIAPVPEETELRFYRETRRCLLSAGYQHYEISNFARPGHRSLHNTVYWHDECHLALGPSAVGLLDSGRYRNAPRLDDWLRRLEDRLDPAVEHERLEGTAALRETVMMALRLERGIHEGRLRRRFGRGFDALDSAELERACREGLLVRDAHRLRLTERGRELADTVAARLL